jgi:hypothetical protein
MCYNYGEKGHYSNRCPNSRTRANQPAITTPTPTRGANSVPVAAKQNYAHGRVNHVAMKKRKKLLMLSLVYFSSMTPLQLCYLILEHRILSYLLHML